MNPAVVAVRGLVMSDAVIMTVVMGGRYPIDLIFNTDDASDVKSVLYLFWDNDDKVATKIMKQIDENKKKADGINIDFINLCLKQKLFRKNPNAKKARAKE